MSFRRKLTWASSPLIVNAPMGDFAGPELAAAVSAAGGLGMIGGMLDPAVLSRQLEDASELLNGANADGNLSIGVGLLLFALTNKRAAMIEVLTRHKPAVVWLFAESQLNDYSIWAAEIREAVPESQLWIQTGSVTSALEIARGAGPDVLVMQGTDAGGHGWERGAGIISLVPETKDALAREALDIAVVASGGITDARGAAAAFALGAEAVVMGTRFLASKEVMIHPLYQQQIIEAHDGGQQTVRTKVFDELRGPNIWPAAYNGRGLISESFKDHTSGVELDEIRARHKSALEQDEKGWGVSRRAVVWSGTGVGLVHEVQPAAEIVQQVRDGVLSVFSSINDRW